LDKVHQKKWVRVAFLIAGSILVGLGVVGIFLPILPTTPFLLLAAACYARSSERFYQWLLNHRWFETYLRPYREGKGIPMKAKVLSITLIWTMILFSILLIIHPLVVRILLILIAAGVTLYLLSLPNFRKSTPTANGIETQGEGKSKGVLKGG